VRRSPFLIILVALFALVACGDLSQRDDSAEPGDHEARIARVIGGLHPGSAPEGEPLVDHTLQERMAHYGVPGVGIAVIHQGRIDWARGYGVAEAGTRRPVTPETLFQAASISKPLTAMAALRLADEGRLELDADVNDHLTSWKLQDNEFTGDQKVTPAHLLSHTAGLTVPGFRGYAAGQAVPSLQEVLEGAPPANSDPIRVGNVPGDDWSYSGGGYCVVQQLMEDVTGRSFPELMDSLLLEPLGMSDSTFHQPIPLDLAQDAALGHGSTGEVVPGGWHTYPEMAAAGLWTTPSDLARFAMGVQESVGGGTGAVLSPEMAAQLVTPRYGNFSLGLVVRDEGANRWFTHNGGNEGYRCLMFAYVEAGDGAVVMTNSDNGMELASEIISSIAREYSWPALLPEDAR
jgi:CubicO group peptidase (beta-lactamase class C family)